MTRVAEWISARTPAPPPTLATRLRTTPGTGPVTDVLTVAAQGRLAEAIARPGRVRESAFSLLEADALLTYACEAALTEADPESALLDILAAVGR